MKILMLGWELPPHNSGGLGVACLYLAQALVKAGAEIDFVVPYADKHMEITEFQVLSAGEIPPKVMQTLGAYTHVDLGSAEIDLSQIQNGGGSIRAVQRVYCEYVKNYCREHDGRTAARQKPAVVHAHDWLTYEAGLLAKRELGAPLIAHVHATEFDRSGMRRGNELIHAIEGETLLAADRILAVSEATKQIVHEKYAIPLQKIEVVYNSLGANFLEADYHYEVNQYVYIEQMKQAGYTIVATIGRFTAQKGLTHLMRAARLALEVEEKLLFVFAGDGEQKNELIQLAADLGISQKVLFTGFIRGQRLRDVYSMADIFVMSSISEPFGLTALEAAHHGNALILSRQAGVAEVLRSVMTYDFWDLRKLADEIVAIATRQALRQTLQTGVRREYLNISWGAIAQKCLHIYNRVNGKNHAGY